MLGDSQVLEFKAALRGQLISPADTEFDSARKVFNAMIDRRPALIARCAGAADVIACVRFAREHSCRSRSAVAAIVLQAPRYAMLDW